ncbi:hypothetical protein GCM10009827_057800 [Dactylosporangium maewongense]|uniref:WD40 repeat domain-containing protein n=1 Tax=Dactylosporangium maewongense TaxID=634393 RepID=A0ABN2B3Q0_9ACTN
MRDPLGPPFAVRDGCWGDAQDGLFGAVAHGRPVLVRVGRDRDRQITVYDAATGVTIGAAGVGKWHAMGGFITSHLSTDHVGPVLVTALDGEVVRQWRLPHPAPAAPELRLARPGDVKAPWVCAVTSYVHDGRMVLVLGDSDGVVRRFDAASGAEVAPPLVHDDRIHRIAAYTVDGRPHLACGEDTGRLWRWDAVTGVPVGPPVSAHLELYFAIVPFEIGGRTLLATSSADQSIRRVDPVSGDLVGDFRAFEEGAAVCLAPGPVLAVVEGGNLWRFDLATFEPVAAPVRFGDECLEAVCALDVDGRAALFVAGEKTIRRFDATTGEPWPTGPAA